MTTYRCGICSGISQTGLRSIVHDPACPIGLGRNDIPVTADAFAQRPAVALDRKPREDPIDRTMRWLDLREKIVIGVFVLLLVIICGLVLVIAFKP